MRSLRPGAMRARTVKAKAAARPTEAFDVGMQHERTAMAWERTAFNLLVGGTVLARYSADDGLYLPMTIGIGVVAVAVIILVWAADHYEDLHGPLRSGQSPIHPTATRLVGLVTIGASATALLLAIERVFFA